MRDSQRASEQITAEVTSWSGVEAGPGRRGEFAFKVDGREIGHLHGDHAAHFSFPKEVWSELVNGWDNVKDDNRAKSVGGQLTLTPGAWLTVYANYLGGAERAEGGDWRHLYDVVAVLQPGRVLKLTLNYDYATERNGAGPTACRRLRRNSGSQP